MHVPVEAVPPGHVLQWGQILLVERGEVELRPVAPGVPERLLAREGEGDDLHEAQGGVVGENQGHVGVHGVDVGDHLL